MNILLASHFLRFFSTVQLYLHSAPLLLLTLLLRLLAFPMHFYETALSKP